MSDLTSDAETEAEAMTLSEIREIVDSDKQLAVDVVREARSEIASFRMLELSSDITGKPDGVNQFNRYKREQLRSLETVTQSPFFARYRARMTMNGEEEEIDGGRRRMRKSLFLILRVEKRRFWLSNAAYRSITFSIGGTVHGAL